MGEQHGRGQDFFLWGKGNQLIFLYTYLVTSMPFNNVFTDRPTIFKDRWTFSNAPNIRY
jgi:hypothetical protein